MTTERKNRLGKLAKMLVATGALSLGAINANAQDSVELEDGRSESKVSEVVPESSLLPFSGYLSTGFHSKYRVSGGAVLDDTPVNQTYLGLSFPDVLIKGDSITPYVWSNTSLERGTVSEFDVGTNYSFPIFKNFLGGSLGGSLEGALWDYPDGTLGEYDIGLIGRLNYSNQELIDLELKGTQLFTNGFGRAYVLTASKPIKIGNIGDTTLTLTPKTSVAFQDDMYGINGFSAVQYGASLRASRGRLNTEVYVTQQEPLMDGYESGPAFGISFGIGF